MTVVELVRSICDTDLSSADTATVSRVLDQLRRVKNWGESVEIGAARRLRELAAVEPTMLPEKVVAEAAKVPVRETMRRFDRAKTTASLPQLGAALDAGDASGAHVDVITAALRGLTVDQQHLLLAGGVALADAASRLPADQFAKHVRRTVDRITADGGMSRLDRQKRNTRLRTWVDRDSGMFHVSGQYDPETGLRLAARLDAMVETMFHQRTPDTAPDDPVAKREHLAALALAALVRGKGRAKGKTELVVVVDAKTLLEGEHADTFVDVGMDIDLPIETVRRMACSADVFVPVLSAANGVNLYQGRKKRLATEDQRRLLRLLYPTCMMPGCSTPFDDCDIHHIDYFGRDFGLTNIDTQGPLCFRDHDDVHRGRVSLSMDELRNLTVTYGMAPSASIHPRNGQRHDSRLRKGHSGLRHDSEHGGAG